MVREPSLIEIDGQTYQRITLADLIESDLAEDLYAEVTSLCRERGFDCLLVALAPVASPDHLLSGQDGMRLTYSVLKSGCPVMIRSALAASGKAPSPIFDCTKIPSCAHPITHAVFRRKVELRNRAVIDCEFRSGASLFNVNGEATFSTGSPSLRDKARSTLTMRGGRMVINVDIGTLICDVRDAKLEIAGAGDRRGSEIRGTILETALEVDVESFQGDCMFQYCGMDDETFGQIINHTGFLLGGIMRHSSRFMAEARKWAGRTTLPDPLSGFDISRWVETAPMVLDRLEQDPLALYREESLALASLSLLACAPQFDKATAMKNEQIRSLLYRLKGYARHIYT